MAGIIDIKHEILKEFKAVNYKWGFHCLVKWTTVFLLLVVVKKETYEKVLNKKIYLNVTTLI